MEVTIWVEKSLGLNITKVVAEGSTIATLKAELIADDLFGSLDAKDLILVSSGNTTKALDDAQILTGSLSELEIVTQEAPGGTDGPALGGTDGPAFVDARVPMANLPEELGEELKWFTWNVLWHSSNSALANNPGMREAALQRASEDLGRVEKHFELALLTGSVTTETLHQLRRQVEQFGDKAAGGIAGFPLDVESCVLLSPPSDFEQTLWSGIQGFARLGAEALNAMFQVHFQTKPAQQEKFKQKGNFYQHKFEHDWQQLYKEGAVLPSPIKAPRMPDEFEAAKAEEDEKRMAQLILEREEKQRQKDMEKKAQEQKEKVEGTASGARKLLGSPLIYNVVSDCAVYQEPMPQAKKTATLMKGSVVFGYPGSAAWIRVDPRRSTGFSKECLLLPYVWVPVRIQDGEKRDLALAAVWHEIKAERVCADSIEITWPGVDQPEEPNVAEYTVEVRQKQEAEAKARTAITGTTKTKAVVSELTADTAVQIRVNLKIVGPYTTDFRLAGPWRDFQTAARNEPEESELEVSPESDKGTDVEGEGIYEVMHTFVTLRGEPTTKGMILGTIKKGGCVFGVPFNVGKEPWIKLSIQTIPAPVPNMPPREITANDNVFVLIDATPIPSLKLGVLLKRVGDGGAGDDKKKLGEWKVIHDKVVVRETASVDSAALGFQKLGAKVLGVCLPIGGVDWLRVQNPGLGNAERPDVWMLIDGTPIGLGRLLERLGDAPASASQKRKKGALPKSTTRPLPPKPLAVLWLAAHGGLPSPPKTAREVPLVADLDVGMASECSLLYVEPADGSSEVSYVAKRCCSTGDMGHYGREYRFYTDIINLQERLEGKGANQPNMLGNVLRVPKCMVANWGKEGKEREGFLLLMERLDPPEWVHVDPEVGCTFEQARTALETLGQMHKVFSSNKFQNELEWLPVTMLDVRNAGFIQNYFSMTLHSAKPLVQMLPPEAQACVEKMAEGGLGECFEKLAEPPLTLNHGDYRPENLRFSPPGQPLAVAAFDWGLVNCARGMADFAYFLMLSMPPQERRDRERELLKTYLEARGDGGERNLEDGWEELKFASVAILGMILMTRQFAKTGQHKQETRNMLSRMMRWVGEAITDWKSIDVVKTYYD